MRDQAALALRTYDAWSARLCLSRRARDEPASDPSHNALEASPPILEPEVPAGGMEVIAQSAWEFVPPGLPQGLSQVRLINDS